MSLNGDCVFRIAMQMDSANQEILDEKWAWKDEFRAWAEHYLEIDWPSETLQKIASIAGQPPEIFRKLKYRAISKMECDKAAGQCGVVAAMLNATEDLRVELMRLSN